MPSTTTAPSRIGPLQPPAAAAYQLHFRKASGLATMRWLVAAGLLCLGHFGWWATTATRPGYAPLFWLLMVSLAFKGLQMLHEWVHYVQVRVPVPPPYAPAPRRVDVLTTACPGEPRAMIIRTITAIQAIRYPHTSYLCDEGDDPVLRAACARLGVVHVTRHDKTNAKAGNINNALRQATGELCVVLDPDHVPTPDFLDHVLPYFEDPQVGYVQVVQAYGNQSESLVARGAAEQTYHFYGPLMMGMNGYGTVQAIGANCTFRRAALDSIGGHAPGLTEDMHTAMLLHAAGWKSAYVPTVVSRGLVPASLAAFYAQQLKWSRGAFDLLFRVYPRLFGRLSWAQRIHYLLLPLYFFSGVVALIDLVLPLLALGSSQFPWLVNLGELAQHAGPLVGVSLLIRCYAQRWLREPGEGGLHLTGGLLCLGAWWVYATGFVYAVLGVRVPYLPTPKVGRWHNEWLMAAPNLVLALLLLGACKYGRMVAYGSYTNIMVVLALANVALLVAATVLGQHQVVRNFVQDMASRPFRWLVLSLHHLYARGALQTKTWLRQHSQTLAMAVLAVGSLANYLRADWLAHTPPEWLLTGAQTVHVGQATADARAAGSTSLLASLWTNVPSASELEYDIIALAGPASDRPAFLPPLVGQVAARQQVPLLSWTVSAADTESAAYWRALARQVAGVPGPVLLRPLLQAPNPASARRAWQLMVRSFRRERVSNAVWAWTPAAGDARLEGFPGIAYTTWIACPLQNGPQSMGYAALRAQLTQNLVLHQMPVLLLAPAPQGTLLRRAARSLAAAYPEINAVVFAAVGSGRAPAPARPVRYAATTPPRPTGQPFGPGLLRPQ